MVRKRKIWWFCIVILLFFINNTRYLNCISYADNEYIINNISTRSTVDFNNMKNLNYNISTRSAVKVNNKSKKAKTKFKKLNKVGYAKCNLNIRKKPSIDSDIIGTYLVGNKIKIKGKINNNWYKTNRGYVSCDYVSNKEVYYACEATAYANPRNNKTADCSDTIEGLTLAGRKEWLGRSCYLYRCNSDGSVGECLGYYEFHDTGWGIDGDILRGETVDIFMESEEDCKNWGRQNVLVKFNN